MPTERAHVKYHPKRCPVCAVDLTTPLFVTVHFSVCGQEFDKLSHLLETGELVEPMNGRLIEQGYHAGSFCAECGELLAEDEPPEEEESDVPRLTSYHFDIGDSASGPLGLCARVGATSRVAALEMLRQELDEEYQLAAECGPDTIGVQYVQLYVNPRHITLEDSDPDKDQAIR